MHPQVRPSFNKLINASYPEGFLCFSHCFPFNWSSLFQNRWSSNFFVKLDLLWRCTWRRLWTHEGIIHSSKLNEICNKPSKMKYYLNMSLHLVDLRLQQSNSKILIEFEWKCRSTHNGGRFKASVMYSRTGPPSETTKCSTLGGPFSEGHGSKRPYLG